MRFRGTVLLNDVHGASLERDDDASVIVAVQGEGGIRKDEGTPDADVVILELRKALGLRRGLLGTHDAEACGEADEEEKGRSPESFHPARNSCVRWKWIDVER
jgi:hypothetical protein